MGLVHRDIKPANVFLCRRWGEPDAVKVLDFGLAKNNAEPPASVTAQNVVLGTPLYISPEAMKSAALVDVRSDIYSLGAVAYYMLTAEPVFTGLSAVEVCAKHLHSTPGAPERAPGQRRSGRSGGDRPALPGEILGRSLPHRRRARARPRRLRRRGRMERRPRAKLVAAARRRAGARSRGRWPRANGRDRSGTRHAALGARGR